MKLIDKDSLVAEIEKRKHMCDFHHGEYWDGCYNTMEDLISFLNTPEVKEIQVKESAILQHKEETCKENDDSLTQEPVSEDLGEYINELSKQFPEVSFAKLSRIAVRVAKWQKEQMMKEAFDFTKEHNTACILASECLRNHGWFSRERDFNDLFRHLSCVDKLFEGKFSGKTKVIVIKED